MININVNTFLIFIILSSNGSFYYEDNFNNAFTNNDCKRFFSVEEIKEVIKAPNKWRVTTKIDKLSNDEECQNTWEFKDQGVLVVQDCQEDSSSQKKWELVWKSTADTLRFRIDSVLLNACITKGDQGFEMAVYKLPENRNDRILVTKLQRIE